MQYHLSFEDSSNPYICFTMEEFLKWFRAYDIEIIKLGFYHIKGERESSSYESIKESVQQLAKDYSLIQSEVSISWEELSEYQSLFYTLGKRYGLIKEFKENGII